MKFFNSPRLNLSDLVFSQASVNSLESVSSVGASDLIIYTLNSSDYSSAKFVIHVKSSDEMLIKEVFALHNGVSGFLTEYAIVYNSSAQSIINDTLSFEVNGNDLNLILHPSTSSIRNVITQGTSITI